MTFKIAKELIHIIKLLTITLGLLKLKMSCLKHLFDIALIESNKNKQQHKSQVQFRAYPDTTCLLNKSTCDLVQKCF